MVQQSLNVAYSDGSSQVLWEDGERVFSRGWRLDDNGNRLVVLLVAPAADHPSRTRLDRLIGAYRDNEVAAAHPLMRKLDAIKAAGGKVVEITLSPRPRGFRLLHLGRRLCRNKRACARHGRKRRDHDSGRKDLYCQGDRH
jgi:hypothetical protein